MTWPPRSYRMAEEEAVTRTAMKEATGMLRDPIVEEMRRIKEEHAARFNYDIRAMGKSLQEEQKRSGRKVVSYARRRPVAHESGKGR